MIDNSEFGFVNTATNPEYRVFLTGTDIYVENWSNQLSEGTAIVKLRGMFMGTGPRNSMAHSDRKLNHPTSISIFASGRPR